MDIQEILTDLSYSMRQPEADELNNLIKMRHYDAAISFLKKYLSEKEAILVFNYLKEKVELKFDLIEIEAKDISRDKEQMYLFKIGDSVEFSQIDFDFHSGEKIFFCNAKKFKITQASQIWKAIARK